MDRIIKDIDELYIKITQKDLDNFQTKLNNSNSNKIIGVKILEANVKDGEKNQDNIKKYNDEN